MDRCDFFKNLGFSEYESKLISSLVKLKTADVKEISLDSNVPRNKLYAIMRKFEEEGLISLVSIEPKKYKLINFDSYIKDKIKEKEDNLKELKEASKSLDNTDVEGQFVFSLIKGQKAIMNKLVELNKNARKEILGVQRNWKYWGEGVREMGKSVKRGVNVRLIGVINSETLNRAEEWKKAGCKIKVYNQKLGKYPLRFSVFDRKYARITIGKPEIKESKDYITILTDSKPLVNMLRNQFLQMWKECESFKF
ncbi:hypothetical protein A3K73_00170 [Candidatus Pacearchaeota archaeon RBG_13_36_9]|nr:MAG: hypothetical protein A3K73_00170 [Candidatus Pacearchaeota archaeon RBG_13_36_9]